MAASKGKTLFLPVERQYFHQIKSREKPQEYRVRSDHWVKRIEGKAFDFVEITDGYPTVNDRTRRIKRRWVGVVKVDSLVHEHFKNVPTDVFVIDVTGEDVTI